MSNIEINGNFHILDKKESSSGKSQEYQEYRRKWSEYPRQKMVGPFPLHLDIETTPSCNLKCSFCQTTYMDLGKGLMKFALFKKIIDEGAEKGLYAIKLNWRGEPLLHPEISEMIAYAKNKGIADVFLNTNATLLSESKSRDIIEAGLDRIIISFDGFDKIFFESQRIGANFEKTLENIQNLVKIKKSLRKSIPWVRVQTILIDELKSSIKDYCKFWSKIVDEVACIDLKNEVNRISVGKNDWACPQLWQRMTIAWDGHIMPCVNDPNCKMSLGKVNEISIEEAWKDDKLSMMRRLHSKGLAHKIEGCLDCPLRSAQILKEKVSAL